MKNQNGFTLLELMAVVAIAAILSVTAFGFYTDNVRKANRTDARSLLTSLAGNLEKCRSLYGSYNSANCTVNLPQNTGSNLYSVAAANLGATTFTLTATPIAGTVQADDGDCATISLTNTGLKTATGANPPDCW